VATGKVLGAVTQRHRAADFIQFLEKIDRAVPPRRPLHLVLDNSSTHKTLEVTAWLAAHPRFTLHFTPTSASSLNAVEGWFAQLERRCGAPRFVHERRRPAQRTAPVHRGAQQVRGKAVRLDQVRRRHPGHGRAAQACHAH
jgi:transposase